MATHLVVVLAHAVHWLEFALFAPPTALVLAATVRSVLADRARRRAADRIPQSTLPPRLDARKENP
jgi:hypothetical protein